VYGRLVTVDKGAVEVEVELAGGGEEEAEVEVELGGGVEEELEVELMVEVEKVVLGAGPVGITTSVTLIHSRLTSIRVLPGGLYRNSWEPS